LPVKYIFIFVVVVFASWLMLV